MSEIKGNPFDPESMVETFKVGGQELKLEPMKIKTFRKIIGMVDETIGGLAKIDKNTSIGQLGEIVVDKYVEVVLLLFPQERFPFFTREFFDENFTVPLARRLLDSAIKMNGLEEVFPFLKKLSGDDPSKIKTGV